MPGIVFNLKQSTYLILRTTLKGKYCYHLFCALEENEAESGELSKSYNYEVVQLVYEPDV